MNEVVLTGFSYGGEALGHIDGQVIFVSGGISGERVRIEITESRQHFLRGRVTEVLEASSERILPLYPELRDCGCAWQYMSYAAQLHWKTEIVRELLQKIGGCSMPEVLPAIGVTDPALTWKYRNHAQFVCDQNGRMGVYHERSHQIQDMQSYPLLTEKLNGVYQRLRHAVQDFYADAGYMCITSCSVRGVPHTEDRYDALITLHMQDHTSSEDIAKLTALVQASCGESTTTVILQKARKQIALPQDFLLAHIDRFTFRISAGSFFQVNDAQLLQMVSVVQHSLNPDSSETLLDAYSGVGLFSTFLAAQYKQIYCIESAPSSVADARYTMTMHGQKNIRLQKGTVEHVLSTFREPVDQVVLDPPRAGCDPAVIRALLEKSSHMICYVSCNPATLARDIKVFCEQGKYRLMQVQPLDMFPQTYHIEAIAQLVRV